MFFSCAFCQRACPSLLSQLSRYTQPHSHALTPTHPAWFNESRSTLFVSCPKTVTLHRALSYTLLSLSSTPTSSHVQHPALSEHKPCRDPLPHLSGALGRAPTLHCSLFDAKAVPRVTLCKLRPLGLRDSLLPSVAVVSILIGFHC